MKSSKILRVLAFAFIASVALIAMPTVMALAAEEIELDPDDGEIDTYFYVEGDGFPQSTPPTVINKVDIYFSSQEADAGDDIDDEVTIYERLKSNVEVDEDGEFEKRVRVPSRLSDGDETEDVYGGTYYVYVTMADDDDINAVAQFTVLAGRIDLDIEMGIVGTEIEISGSYFTEREYITITYDDEPVNIESGDKKTDSAGKFECSILVPPSTAGDHNIAVEDESEHKAEAKFTVEPEITMGLTSGAIGDEVTVTGTGFSGDKHVTITFDGKVVDTVRANEYGSFATSFEVPDVAAGIYDVRVEDEDGNKGELEFTLYIATSVSISPVTTLDSPGHVGMDITISGVGFKANSLITITYATKPIVVATTTGDADGAFTATFKVPQSESGEHIITASDDTNTLASTFIMESTPPPIPSPLLPRMSAKTESPVYFDWEDVIDASLPVTYTLQIATDENFSAHSIVLEKKDLTNSEYTIAKGLKLEPTREYPYYWRVKATDSASNESGWSAPRSFYIVGRFAWPSWISHVWWGLGAMGAGLFGIWVGRRTAPRD